MSNIDEFVNATNRMLNEEQQKYNEAVNEKILYDELRDEAARKEKNAKVTIKELELAKMHAEKAQETASEKTETVYVEEKTEAVKKSNNGTKGLGIVNLVVAATLLVGGALGYKLYKESKTGDVRSTTSATYASDTVKTNPEAAAVNQENGSLVYDNENNEAVVYEEYEELTTENFENLVADYANKYSNQYTEVSTQDITEFAVTANIDILAEENPELIKEIAGGQTKEEFLNDAAKLIGATVMDNFTVWNSTHSTEGFVKVSDIIYGSQKEQMIKIEEYVARIADAANQDDADKVNEIVAEFLTDMNSGDLSKLDDGVGFAAQIYIATISDGIARNYLNKENFDMFQVLKTSEKYVSNIFAVYEKCLGETKTLTR